MKSFLFFPVLFLISSCGVTEQLSKNCGSSIEMGCNLVFGMKDADQDEQIAKNTFKNDEQDSYILDLQNKNTNLINTMNSLSVQINQLQVDDVSNKEYLVDLIDSLETTVGANLLTLQSLSTSLQGSITNMIDVCGDQSGHFDEVILKTNNGKYLAYFEQGGKRFLTQLSFGSYQTTDNQACHFTVSAAGLTHVAGSSTRID